jgi:hypothetical protein
MTSREEVEQRIRAEMEDAQRSRQQGNEGRARVCARRAAGWAVGWFVETNHLAEPHQNALDHLHWLTTFPEVTQGLKDAAGRLTTKINEDGSLPHAVDPLEDARLIIETVLAMRPD